jgi:hypothetical protein
MMLTVSGVISCGSKIDEEFRPGIYIKQDHSEYNLWHSTDDGFNLRAIINNEYELLL